MCKVALAFSGGKSSQLRGNLPTLPAGEILSSFALGIPAQFRATLLSGLFWHCHTQGLSTLFRAYSANEFSACRTATPGRTLLSNIEGGKVRLRSQVVYVDRPTLVAKALAALQL